jgi:hypothetical protein
MRACVTKTARGRCRAAADLARGPTAVGRIVRAESAPHARRLAAATAECSQRDSSVECGRRAADCLLAAEAGLAGRTLAGHARAVALLPLLERINTYLKRWAGRKHKRLRTYKRVKAWWLAILDRDPELFAQWRWARTFA